MKEEMNLLPKDLTTTKITNDVGEDAVHVYEPETITAVNAALAIHRPLLVWGETGIGKSQLARAVARELKRVFIPFVCDVHTEPRDLLWHFDAVARLADAQIQGAIPAEERKADTLDIENYIVPQALWWALNWDEAKKMKRASPPTYQSPCDPENGVVVLIDEIDKTASDVPNGLLEALGNRSFHPQGMEPVEADKAGVAPLVIVTTNGERNLPDAFIRRCLSLRLDFPADEDRQRELLVKRGRENFSEFEKIQVEDGQGKPVSLLEQAANYLIEDRKAAEARRLYPLCGQAEYFDLLRGIKKLEKQEHGSPGELLNELRRYTYQKLTQDPAG